ncbi:MAG: hypothetical protein PVF83_10075 [Anaerolineales bacterium]|jgi:hypothetical protein
MDNILSSPVNNRQVAVAFIVGVLVMLPPLSMPHLSQWIGWLAATLVVLRSHTFPHPFDFSFNRSLS